MRLTEAINVDPRKVLRDGVDYLGALIARAL